jgi:Sec-independent protein translocase protein TatA
VLVLVVIFGPRKIRGLISSFGRSTRGLAKGLEGNGEHSASTMDEHRGAPGADEMKSTVAGVRKVENDRERTDTADRTGPR